MDFLKLLLLAGSTVDRCFFCPTILCSFYDLEQHRSMWSVLARQYVELQVGGFDPITRKAMTVDQMVPNVALRNATLQYLEEHPWAWVECC